LQNQNREEPLKGDSISTSNAIQLACRTHDLTSDNMNPNPPDNHTISPSQSDNDHSATVKQDAPSSCGSSVVLTFQVDAIETPLEWSARMKRYQQEEIQYLGLDILKPRISLPAKPVIKPLSAVKTLPLVQAIHPHRPVDNSSRNDMVLSKQRFEEWLDTLHPHESPRIPTSQPSTVAFSTISKCSSENDQNDNLLQPRDDFLTHHFIPPLDSNTCNGCGRSISSETVSRDWGVQTDVSGCLIII
jgi:hypothetical protein